ncbi:hypothetical protein N7492_008901 [Penicillium capsulatum]|uniref:Protein-lysine N-methyltransferase EFM4 n=1 Tax=Penicillium capsulatum TaxID=69766 RepID=A0A9W9HQL6_9EURO|nr:hypothetical protein N7492_008901 [Penicillium capsulatum]KAJ6106301.1 hypothetical protein N7512_009818 [Penicillium capsulatum]
MTSNDQPSYLSPSELGSKDYWENYYSRTLAHISNDKPAQDTDPEQGPQSTADKTVDSDADSDLNDEDDPGTSWFSEHNAPEKVLRFLTRSSFPLAPRNTRASAPAPAISGQPTVLDLGTGNGSMLALLQKKGGFTGQMVGVDYSAQSIELARELQRVRGHSAYRTDSEESKSDTDSDEDTTAGSSTEAAPCPAIQFEEWDILSSKALLSQSGTPVDRTAADEVLSWFPYDVGGFDIVLDKGTFDAVSLAADARDTRVCERYPGIARRLVRRGGFLVVTSCNWTEEELVSWFTRGEDADRLVVWGSVEYPRFRFGGHEGQGVCTVCFQRVGDS